MNINGYNVYALLTAAKEFIGGEYDQVDEELKELNEGHDGEAEPQTKHTTGVWDVLQQLKHNLKAITW